MDDIMNIDINNKKNYDWGPADNFYSNMEDYNEALNTQKEIQIELKLIEDKMKSTFCYYTKKYEHKNKVIKFINKNIHKNVDKRGYIYTYYKLINMYVESNK